MATHRRGDILRSEEVSVVLAAVLDHLGGVRRVGCLLGARLPTSRRLLELRVAAGQAAERVGRQQPLLAQLFARDPVVQRLEALGAQAVGEALWLLLGQPRIASCAVEQIEALDELRRGAQLLPCRAHLHKPGHSTRERSSGDRVTFGWRSRWQPPPRDSCAHLACLAVAGEALGRVDLALVRAPRLEHLELGLDRRGELALLGISQLVERVQEALLFEEDGRETHLPEAPLKLDTPPQQPPILLGRFLEDELCLCAHARVGCLAERRAADAHLVLGEEGAERHAYVEALLAHLSGREGGRREGEGPRKLRVRPNAVRSAHARARTCVHSKTPE